MSRPVRAVLAAATLAVVATGLAACQPTGPKVLIFGDSITIESKGSGEAATLLRGYQVDWSGTKYMTSPCNGIKIAKTITYRPDVVVINYAGNPLSFQNNCMAGERYQALADRYAKDVKTLIDLYRNGVTKVVIVGAPARKPSLEETNLVFTTMQAVAAAPGNQVAFFDGGRYITPDRTRTTRAATCLPSETGAKCGTSQDPKKNYIRDEKHEHLCPTGGKLNGTCGMYSSGAVRLTLNLRDAIKAAKVPVH
jgi:hypothetical protein